MQTEVLSYWQPDRDGTFADARLFLEAHPEAGTISRARWEELLRISASGSSWEDFRLAIRVHLLGPADEPRDRWKFRAFSEIVLKATDAAGSMLPDGPAALEDLLTTLPPLERASIRDVWRTERARLFLRAVLKVMEGGRVKASLDENR